MGAIAGGVVGGVAFVAILTFLVYWFCIRKKRQEYDEKYSEHGLEERSTIGANRRARQSTRSVASTAFTRASNVIQIAYIPGVTNRSPPDTPAHTIPPVPPVPVTPLNSARNSALLSPYHPQDQHFFMPDDGRDSSYSELSAGTHDSISPSLVRSSVATTIYRNNAIVSPLPAQQAHRWKPAVVSVRSGTSTPMCQEIAPAVPEITQAQLHKAEATSPVSTYNQSSITGRTMVARSVNTSGPQSRAPSISEDVPSAAPVQNPPNTPVDDSRNSLPFANDPSSDDTSSDGQVSLHPHTYQQTTVRQSSVPTVIDDTPALRQSPFSDSQANAVASGYSPLTPTFSAHGSSHRHRASLGSNASADVPTPVITADLNNGKQSSRGTPSSPLSASRSLSPFSDHNVVQKS